MVLRLLDPRWSTVVGTVREWSSTEYWGGPPGSFPPHAGSPWSGGVRGYTVAVAAPGPDGQQGRPGESEVWRRMWVRRDGRSRVERRASAGGEPWLTEVHQPDGVYTVRSDGTATRGDPPILTSSPTWLVDAGALLGVLRIELGTDDEFAGRAVVHASATARRELSPMAMSVGPMLFGMPIGGRSELSIDVETGIVLRFATYEGARLIGLRQFVDIAIDDDIPEDLLTFRLEAGQRFRTPVDDQLDMLRAVGVDTSLLDAGDEVAVQQAVDDHHRRQSEAFGGHRERALSELIAPLGPPPADREVARDAIEAAVVALGSAPDEGVASCVDRGELFDALPAQPPHPAMGSQTASFELTDMVFVRDDEAMIAFTIRLSGGSGFPTKGRAVRRGDRWLVSYDTWAGLQQMGGVSVPSLLDHPDEEA